MNKIKSGFISIIGEPNVGKSTLINSLVKTKIAITANKPQTTRNNITGVYNDEEAQLVFIDTPGIHKAKHSLGKTMNKEALSTLNSVDIILYVVDTKKFLNDINLDIIKYLNSTKTKKFLIINKIDLFKKEKEINQIIDMFKEHISFDVILPISSLNNINLNFLIYEIKNNLDFGPKYFPDDYITDKPEKFLISEIIREKIIINTKEEIPHSVAVVVEELKEDEFDSHVLLCRCEIIVERDSQKGIIIGKQGEMLKKIGSQARLEINNLLATKIHLELWVRVKKDWRNKQLHLKNLGYFEDK